MADEKRQNPFEEMGRSDEGEAADHPPAYTAGPSTQPSRLPVQQAPSQSSHKPIAIPAITSSSDSPFIRAYPPVLRNHQLPKESFLTFLDQLNKDIVATVSGLASLGSQGMSKSRTDSSVKQANKDIFGPRGLRVEIGKLDALAHVAKLPILDSQGKINRQAPLFLQLQNEASMANAEIDERQQQELNLQRRIATLQPWIAELEFEILPWSSKSKLTRFNASLKKYNEPRDQETRNRGRPSVVYNQEIKQEEDPFRKALWLVIREVEDERR
ncbi:hypothetical protein N7519_005674 [Penicillium mononematosum]|uniref:uncharacterized protein n=1 Tax=Penicillium mononematosum TaxID=268346 RepID=UPI002549AFDA|nr:uncharacterized protein N7519_005674 [Penicillium mononematosum]KAJ6184373.1 hypothetical protein N7519_005674 [Penicillium mononematosum]